MFNYVYEKCPVNADPPSQPKRTAKSNKRKPTGELPNPSARFVISVCASVDVILVHQCRKKRKLKDVDLFSILKSKDYTLIRRSEQVSSSATMSCFTIRVSTSLGGNHFVDCEVYNTADWTAYKQQGRYKKAFSYVKLQTDTESLEWLTLRHFVSQERFEDNEPSFYKNEQNK